MAEYRIAIMDRSRGGYIHFYKETTTDIFTALVYLDHAILDIANDPHDELKRYWEAVIVDEDMNEVHGTHEGIMIDGTPYITIY